jgi:PKD repeat protein
MRLRLWPCVLLLGWLAACGGGGADNAPPPPPPPPPPPVNQAPTAAFVAPAGVVAGEPAVFDGRSSSDPEGSALRMSWDFGDGGAGGGERIAHVYPAAGTYTAKLWVVDAQGARGELSRSVTVVAGPAATRSVAVAGQVLDLQGQPLSGVEVTVLGRSGVGARATTDAAGQASITVGVGVDAVLRLSKAGYTEQIKRLGLPSGSGADASFDAVLMPRAAAQVLADAATGGSLSGSDGSRLELPAGSLVDAASGAAISGPVQVQMTPVDVNGAALAAFPGRFEGFNPDGSRTPIVSYGTVEFVLTQDGKPLQLKPGARASIDVPVYASQDFGGTALAAGAAMPLWSLDERSGRWVLEGSGTLVAASGSPTGLAMRAEVSHFSWWNADKGYTPFRPKPRCINDVPGQYDSIFEQATICKMLAEMDKPIPAQGARQTPQSATRAKPASVGTAQAAPPVQAAASAPRFPFPAVRIEGDLPMAGGQVLDIPPDYDVLLTGSALNGTWRGQLRVRGTQGESAEVQVPLRPVAVGGRDEAISLPFDAVRAAAVLRLDSYRFTVAAGQGVEIAVAPEASTLSGRLLLRDASGQLLDAVPFGPFTGRSRMQLAAAGEYRIEIQPGAGAPGAYRLQAALANVAARLPSVAVSSASAASLPVVVAQGSTALAMWVETAFGSTPLLKGSRQLGNAEGWAAAQTLASLPGWNAGVPLQAAVDGSGQVWLAWATANGPMLSRGPIGSAAGWSSEQVHSSACHSGGLQRLAVNTAGQAVLMWQRAGTPAGWCTRRYAGAAAAAEQSIASAVPASNGWLSLALTPAGRALAAWTLDAFGGIAFAEQAAGDSGFGAPSVLVASGSAGVPLLSVAAEGDEAVVLGYNQSGAIWALRRPAGLPWSDPVRLGNASGLAQAAWLGAGRHAIAWGNGAGISVAELDPVNGWGSTIAVGAGLRLPILAQLRGNAQGEAALVAVANLRSGAIGTELGLLRRNAATGAWVEAPAAVAEKPAGLNQLVNATGLALARPNFSAVWAEQLPSGELQIRAAWLPLAP